MPVLTPCDDFSLEPFWAAREDDRSKASVGFRGNEVGLTLNGCFLNAQYQIGPQFLLLTTAGTPYEESLFIYLLDSGFKSLDQLELGQPYTPGGLRNLRIAGDQELEFSFFGEDLWRLKVLERPRFGDSPFANHPQIRFDLHRVFVKRHLEIKRLRP